MITIKDELINAEKLLKSANIPDFKNSVRLIFCKVYNIPSNEFESYIIKNENNEFDCKLLSSFRKFIRKRFKHHPLISILGYREFMDLVIPYSKNVLIPRDETEILADMVVGDILRFSKSNKKKDINVLDMCTGSGCLGLSITYAVKKVGSSASINTTLADISSKALRVAKKNLEYNQARLENANSECFKNVNFVKTNLFEKIEEKFDIIVCNPPYIKRGDLENLEIEVKDFEPRLALDGGDDGLDFYRKIIDIAPNYLDDCGLKTIYFEIGIDQSKDIAKLLKKDFEDIKILKDYANIDRYIIAKKRVENVK